MIEIKIKKEWLEDAKKKSEKMGRLKHSILKGKGNITGFLGEYMVADYLKAKIENTYDYDIVKCDIKIDVKSKNVHQYHSLVTIAAFLPTIQNKSVIIIYSQEY
jgi:hypothetical protein